MFSILIASFNNLKYLKICLSSIKKNSIYAIATASVEEINQINILNASLLSMKRALKKLNHKPSIAYIDGLFIPKNLNIYWLIDNDINLITIFKPVHD